MKKKYVISLFLILQIISSCMPELPCEYCKPSKLNIKWEAQINTKAYYNLEKLGNNIVFQDIENSQIKLINANSGIVKVLIKDYTLPSVYEGNRASYSNLSLSSHYMLYENIISNKKSLLMIYDFTKNKLTDSINLSGNANYAEWSGDIKLSFKPFIKDSLLIFGLQNGTLNGYNLFRKKMSWTKQLGKNHIVGEPVVINYNIFFRQSSLSSNLQSVYISNGLTNWAATEPDLILAPIRKGKALICITDYGKVLSFDVKTGHRNLIAKAASNATYIVDIQGTNNIAIADRDNKTIIWDINNGRKKFEYIGCNFVDGMFYSSKSSILMLKDFLGAVTQINAKTFEITCVNKYQNSATYSTIAVSNDSLFLDNRENVQLIKLNH